MIFYISSSSAECIYPSYPRSGKKHVSHGKALCQTDDSPLKDQWLQLRKQDKSVGCCFCCSRLLGNVPICWYILIYLTVGWFQAFFIRPPGVHILTSNLVLVETKRCCCVGDNKIPLTCVMVACYPLIIIVYCQLTPLGSPSTHDPSTYDWSVLNMIWRKPTGLLKAVTVSKPPLTKCCWWRTEL